MSEENRSLLARKKRDDQEYGTLRSQRLDASDVEDPSYQNRNRKNLPSSRVDGSMSDGPLVRRPPEQFRASASRSSKLIAHPKTKKAQRRLRQMDRRRKRPPAQWQLRSQEKKERRGDHDGDEVDDEEPIMSRVSAYCVADALSLSKIIDHFEEASDYHGSMQLYPDVLYCSPSENLVVLVFDYGCVVFWDHTIEEEQRFLKRIRPFRIRPLEKSDIEQEDFEYRYDHENNFSLENDEFVLHSEDPLLKMSISFALAQCTKLDVFENRIEKQIEDSKTLPRTLAKEGRTGMAENQVIRKIGEILMERHNVNLHFDILDSPDFFWEEDLYKPAYDRTFRYLELETRVAVLNQRLDILVELFQMLRDEHTNLHASKLEWIIIGLIVIEVIVEVGWGVIIKDILGLF